MFKIDSTGSTVDNQFTEGNPQSGIPATVISAEWLNAVQNEIVNILIARGITLNKTKSSQVSEFLQRGIDTWYSTFIYARNSICQIDGKIYISQLDGNINHNPASDDGTNWKARITTGEVYVKNSANVIVSKLSDTSSFLSDARLVGSFPAGGTLDFYIGRYMIGLIILISDWGGATGVDSKIYAVSGHSFCSYIQNIATVSSSNLNSLSYLGYTDPYLGLRYVQKFRASSSQSSSVYYKSFLAGSGDEIVQPIL
jgi:hypothetical protein